MTTNTTARVIAITRDDGSMSVEQLQDVLRFLDRLINGSLIDERNHNNDSVQELADYNATGGIIATRLYSIDRSARELRKRLIGV